MLDDHGLFRAGFISLGYEEVKVVGEAASNRDAIAAVDAFPQVMLLDDAPSGGVTVVVGRSPSRSVPSTPSENVSLSVSDAAGCEVAVKPSPQRNWSM